METFTIKDLKIFGISRERAQDWIERGFIIPSISKASGKGTTNIFSRWDLYGICLFMDFLARGLSRWLAAEYVKNWNEVLRGKDIADRVHMNYAVIRLTDVDRRPEYVRRHPGLLPGHFYSLELLVFDNFDNFNLQKFIEGEKYKQNLLIINLREIIEYVDELLE